MTAEDLAAMRDKYLADGAEAYKAAKRGKAGATDAVRHSDLMAILCEIALQLARANEREDLHRA